MKDGPSMRTPMSFARQLKHSLGFAYSFAPPVELSPLPRCGASFPEPGVGPLRCFESVYSRPALNLFAEKAFNLRVIAEAGSEQPRLIESGKRFVLAQRTLFARATDACCHKNSRQNDHKEDDMPAFQALILQLITQ